MKSALKFFGGKAYLAPWIIEHFPEHTHYVEPCFGSGAVLFAKPEKWVNRSEVINDIDGNLMCFWKVMRDSHLFHEFYRIVEATPFSQEIFEESKSIKGSVVDRAVQFFVLARQSRQGGLKSFATMSRNRTRRGMNEQVSAWLTSIEGLPEVHERLKRVVIFNHPALEVIKQQDGPKTLYYLDPPYLPETRQCQAYTHEMSMDDHTALLNQLSDLKGKFILSGYRSLLYDDYATGNGWRKAEKQIDNKASGAKTKEIKTECLWMNY